jgi:hypothetical protein
LTGFNLSVIKNKAQGSVFRGHYSNQFDCNDPQLLALALFIFHLAVPMNGPTEMAFRKPLINLLYSAATGTKKTRTLLTPVGVSIFGAFTLLFVFAAIFIDRLLNLPRILPEVARIPVSIPITFQNQNLE